MIRLEGSLDSSLSPINHRPTYRTRQSSAPSTRHRLANGRSKSATHTHGHKTTENGQVYTHTPDLPPIGEHGLHQPNSTYSRMQNRYGSQKYLRRASNDTDTTLRTAGKLADSSSTDMRTSIINLRKDPVAHRTNIGSSPTQATGKVIPEDTNGSPRSLHYTTNGMEAHWENNGTNVLHDVVPNSRAAVNPADHHAALPRRHLPAANKMSHTPGREVKRVMSSPNHDSHKTLPNVRRNSIAGMSVRAKLIQARPKARLCQKNLRALAGKTGADISDSDEEKEDRIREWLEGVEGGSPAPEHDNGQVQGETAIHVIYEGAEEMDKE